MALRGLAFAGSYDHLAVPLMPRDNISMVSLSSDLLDEVKDVLIPAEMLRIEDSQVIGKGKPPTFFFLFLLPQQYEFSFKYSSILSLFLPTQATLGQCIMDTLSIAISKRPIVLLNH